MLNFPLFLSVTLSILIAIIFMTRKDRNAVNRWLSATIILTVVFQSIIFYIISTGLLHEFWYLFRIGCPFYYLTPPLIYIYISLILKKERKSLRHYLLHIIPFAISVLDISWYYATTTSAQRISEILEIQKVSSAQIYLGAGFLPSIVHYYARFIQRVYFLGLQWLLLVKQNATSKLKSAELKWVILLTTVQTFIVIGYGFFTAQIFRFNTTRVTDSFDAAKETSITITLLGVITICLYLFIHPKILYGVLKPEPRSGAKAKSKASETGQYDWLPIGIDLQDCCSRLEQLMLVEKPFLKGKISLSIIANELKVPVHLLSAILNKHYGKSFSDFINEYRIQHLLTRIKEDSNWDQFTLEGIAIETGFSRTGYYTAFKKLTGKSPGTYLSELDTDPQPITPQLQ